jgi:hypothetical protein
VRGKIRLPAPEQPGKYFGMRLNLCAEMEYFSPDERLSWQRILFYGRGGFDAINPRHFPYQQPDFREPEVIRSTSNRPLPFMFLTRRLGNERQAWLPIDEASAMMRLVYDDFACHVPPEFLANSLQLVLDRLAERAKTKSFVELLPLPTGVKDLGRLKRLFRHRAFASHYRGTPVAEAYLQGPMKELLRANSHYLDDELGKIAEELERRPRYVYANRDRDFTWDGQYAPDDAPATDLDMEMTIDEMPLRSRS